LRPVEQTDPARPCLQVSRRSVGTVDVFFFFFRGTQFFGPLPPPGLLRPSQKYPSANEQLPRAYMSLGDRWVKILENASFDAVNHDQLDGRARPPAAGEPTSRVRKLIRAFSARPGVLETAWGGRHPVERREPHRKAGPELLLPRPSYKPTLCSTNPPTRTFNPPGSPPPFLPLLRGPMTATSKNVRSRRGR